MERISAAELPEYFQDVSVGLARRPAHADLAGAIGSERTSRMYRSVLDEVRSCMAQVQDRRLLDAASIGQQHTAILDAISGGDGERATALLDAHLASAEARLVESFANPAR